MSNIAVIVGERLRIYRNRAGMSQEELAERAGIHPTYVGQLERGEKNATLGTVEKIARALDLPFEILFESIVQGHTDNPVARECCDLITMQPEADQKAILDMIKSLIIYKKI
jgi:transcriptional regulator with XRE-family HTH domain